MSGSSMIGGQPANTANQADNAASSSLFGAAASLAGASALQDLSAILSAAQNLLDELNAAQASVTALIPTLGTLPSNIATSVAQAQAAATSATASVASCLATLTSCTNAEAVVGGSVNSAAQSATSAAASATQAAQAIQYATNAASSAATAASSANQAATSASAASGSASTATQAATTAQNAITQAQAQSGAAAASATAAAASATAAAASAAQASQAASQASSSGSGGLYGGGSNTTANTLTLSGTATVLPVGSSGAIFIDLKADTAVTFSGGSPGTLTTCYLIVQQGGASPSTITWPAGVYTQVPVLTAKTGFYDVFCVQTVDGQTYFVETVAAGMFALNPGASPPTIVQSAAAVATGSANTIQLATPVTVGNFLVVVIFGGTAPPPAPLGLSLLGSGPNQGAYYTYMFGGTITDSTPALASVTLSNTGGFVAEVTPPRTFTLSAGTLYNSAGNWTFTPKNSTNSLVIFAAQTSDGYSGTGASGLAVTGSPGTSTIVLQQPLAGYGTYGGFIGVCSYVTAGGAPITWVDTEDTFNAAPLCLSLEN